MIVMKTKKILLLLLALFLISPVMHSQKNVDQLFNEFSKEKKAVHVSVGKFTMTMVSLFQNTMGVNGVEVFSFDECDSSVKERLNQAIATLKDGNYEPLVTVNEEKEHTKILVKLQDESIRELIVLTTGDSPAIVRIKGKIKPSDIDSVIQVNENKSGKK